MTEASGYCHRCGAPLPQGATFCPKCGTPVPSSQGTSQPLPAPSRTRRNEKGEKAEKHEKREKNEKGGGSGSLIGPIIGGLILVWLGVSFFLEENHYLPSDIWWAYFLLGLGAILIVEGVLLYNRGGNGVGPIIGGGVAIIIGFSAIAQNSWNLQTNLWPLILVALGVFVLIGGIAGRRRVKAP